MQSSTTTAPTSPQDDLPEPDPSLERNVDKVLRSTPKRKKKNKHVQTIASVVRSIEADSGVEPAVTTTEHVAIADNIAVEQHPTRSVLTTEELWQLPKIPKKTQKRSARDADLDDGLSLSKTKDTSNGEAGFASDVAIPGLDTFNPAEEYKKAYFWATAHGPVIEDDCSPRTTKGLPIDEDVSATHTAFKSRSTFAVDYDFWVEFQRRVQSRHDAENDQAPHGLAYWWTRALNAERDEESTTTLLESFDSEIYQLQVELAGHKKLKEEHAEYRRFHSREYVNSMIRKEKAKLADRTSSLEYEVQDLKGQLKKANQKATEAEKKCKEATSTETRKKKENYNLKIKVENGEEENAKVRKEKDKLDNNLAKEKTKVDELGKELAAEKTKVEHLSKNLADEEARVERRDKDIERKRARIQELEMEVEMYKSFDSTDDSTLSKEEKTEVKEDA